MAYGACDLCGNSHEECYKNNECGPKRGPAILRKRDGSIFAVEVLDSLAELGLCSVRLPDGKVETTSIAQIEQES